MCLAGSTFRSLSAAAVLCGVSLTVHPQRQALVPLRPPQTQAVSGIAQGGIQPITGDSPLTLLESFSGKVDAAVQVLPYSFADDTGGSFQVSGLPAGATVLRAWLLVTSFDTQSSQAVGVTFDGNALGSRLADVEDPGVGSSELFCSLYRFEVTAFVAGNGTYGYQASGNSNAFGDALVVVFEHASLPQRTIVIADGAESLQNATTTSELGGLPAGNGELVLFTEADDPKSGGDERIRLNGVTLAGPADLFAANQGNYASLVTVPVTTQAGANTLEIVTEDDWFGLHLALLKLASDKITLGFETEDNGLTALLNGQDVSAGEEFGALVEIDGFPASGLSAAIFDSTPGGPNGTSQDLDLLIDQGNVLILQEQPQQTVPGFYDRPNDDRNGGDFIIGFLGREVPVCSIDLVDIDMGAGTGTRVELFDAEGRARTFSVPLGWTGDLVSNGPPGVRTLDLASLDPQPGFSSTATAVEDPGFDPGRVAWMRVRLGGSGAIDNLTFFAPVVASTIDFEDLGIPVGTQVDPPDFVGIPSGGFLFAPTAFSTIPDVHAGNNVSFWMSNGTTVLAGHGEVLMTRVGGAPFSLLGFDFSGWVDNAEAPFSVVASNGTVANFVPDGICDGVGGDPDFQSFVLPAGFANIESALFVHTGAGTNSGILGVDNLAVVHSGTGPIPFSQGSAPAGSLRPASVSTGHRRDPLTRRP